MKRLPVSLHVRASAEGLRVSWRFGSLLLAVGLVVACGPEEGLRPRGEELGARQQALGLGPLSIGDNGLSVNGLSVNGLSVNGLSVNGLSVNGLSALSFRLWFDGTPTLHEQVMRYIVLCAVPAGESRTYTSLTTLRTYTWAGGLGLAPGWASGATPTVVEQQLVSACLAAHTNPYQEHVPISVLGLKGDGTPLPIEEGELAEFDTTEACFFGNLFTGEGLYAANDRNALAPEQSLSRRCALSPQQSGTDPLCEPIIRLGSCEQLSCTMDADSRYYTQCSQGGVAYQPLTTRIRAASIHQCGNGTCELTERCGTGTTADSCLADCGVCK